MNHLKNDREERVATSRCSYMLRVKIFLYRHMDSECSPPHIINKNKTIFKLINNKLRSNHSVNTKIENFVSRMSGCF